MPLEFTVVVSKKLEDARADTLSRGKEVRDQKSDGGTPTLKGRVQTDSLSREKISGAVQMALLAQLSQQPFEITWTMEDNSNVLHTGQEMIEMGVAVGRHVAVCHEVWLFVKDQITAATTVAELDSIDLGGAYP